MATQTPSEATRVAALLTDATNHAAEAAMTFSDVAGLCEEPNGKALKPEDALKLIGIAVVARRQARWALEDAEKVLEELLPQYDFATEANGREQS
jgi:hypothetical protein